MGGVERHRLKGRQNFGFAAQFSEGVLLGLGEGYFGAFSRNGKNVDLVGFANRVPSLKESAMSASQDQKSPPIGHWF